MRRRTILGATAAVVAVLAAAGCGTGGLGDRNGADATRGKELFTANCAACHTLADAGAVGTAGPNLDHAFAEVRKQGFEESTIFEVVDKVIKYPTQRSLQQDKFTIHTNGPLPTVNMPPDIVKGADREAVAAYVASVAGLPVQPGSGAPAGGGAAAGGDATDGKGIFTASGCAACHTLADAGAAGAVGPNLDQTKPSKAVSVDRVTNGKGAMPAFKGKLSDEQIEAVADYIAASAGK